MLESMIGPDMKKKIMGKLFLLIMVILGWIGLVMVMMVSFVSVNKYDASNNLVGNHLLVFHAQLWPMLVGFFCAGAALVAGGRRIKMAMASVLFIVSLWVMLNAITGWITAPDFGDLNSINGFVAPLMKPVAAVGGFVGILGGIVGVLGSGKYLS